MPHLNYEQWNPSSNTPYSNPNVMMNLRNMRQHLSLIGIANAIVGLQSGDWAAIEFKTLDFIKAFEGPPVEDSDLMQKALHEAALLMGSTGYGLALPYVDPSSMDPKWPGDVPKNKPQKQGRAEPIHANTLSGLYLEPPPEP